MNGPIQAAPAPGRPAAAEGGTRLGAWGHALLRPERLQATAVKLAIVLLAAYAWATVDHFGSAANLHAIMYTVAAVGIAATGMAFVTLGGNLFMLSMAATAAVSTILFASALRFGLWPALAIVAAAGLGIGLVQGLAIGVAGANPIIATIAVASVVTGTGSAYSQGMTVVGRGDASWLGFGQVASLVPNQLVLFVLLAIAAEFVVQRTRFGRELRLIGLNRSAAEIAGVRVGRTLVLSFAFAGFTAAVAGSLFAAQAAQGNLKLGAGLDFDAIAAVLVGGVSIRGGRGRVADAAFGALFLAIVGNVLLVKGLPFETQLVVKGMVVVLSVVLGAAASGMGRWR
jgi:ribose/xylose/arabinose/galactoside ABC-type transport system permease subunit